MSDAPAKVDGGHFYTYMHCRATDGKVFYIGKGCKRRAWSRDGRSQHWHRAAEKHGVKVEICAPWASEAEAFDHEVFLIEAFRGLGHPLTNSTNGGEGVSGFKRTPEQLASQSASRRAYLQTPSGRASIEKASVKLRKRMESPEARALAAAAMIAWTRDPKNAERIAERTKKWSASVMRPESRERRRQSSIEHERRTGSRSKRAREMRLDPEYVSKLNAGRDLYFLDPKNRAAVGKRIREYYSIPENNAAQSERMRSRMGSSEAREYMSRVHGGAPFIHEQTGVVYVSQGLASSATGISQSAISNVLHRKKPSVRGQVFTYIKEQS